MEERDPLKSQAIESSLWELQALQNHILPSVATAAKFINMPLPSVEWDMSRILENSADDVSTVYCDSSTAVGGCVMVSARREV
jgi:U3 small nucleolar RNA-associated protein 19